jgi:hypothetical protein
MHPTIDWVGARAGTDSEHYACRSVPVGGPDGSADGNGTRFQYTRTADRDPSQPYTNVQEHHASPF